MVWRGWLYPGRKRPYGRFLNEMLKVDQSGWLALVRSLAGTGHESLSIFVRYAPNLLSVLDPDSRFKALGKAFHNAPSQKSERPEAVLVVLIAFLPQSYRLGSCALSRKLKIITLILSVEGKLAQLPSRPLPHQSHLLV